MRSTLWLSCLLAVLVAFSSSCRASGPSYDEVASAMPPIPAQHGRIFFFRDGNIFGAAIQPQIKLNGEAVGKSSPRGFFFVDAPPGDYSVTCATEVERALVFTLAAEESKYVRTFCTPGLLAGRVSPELFDPSEGEREVRRCNYNGADLATLASIRPSPASAATQPPPTP